MSVVSWQHDALGRRITENRQGSDPIRFVYAGPRLIEEQQEVSAGMWGTKARYIHGSGLDEILAIEDSSNGLHHVFQDLLGSVELITSPSGTAEERYEYGAFGTLESMTDGLGTPLTASQFGNSRMFAGSRFDSDTGQYHMRARQYEPNTGQFVSRDPLGYVDGPNAYSYALSNSVDWTDPFGLEAETGMHQRAYGQWKLTEDPTTGLSRAFLEQNSARFQNESAEERLARTIAQRDYVNRTINKIKVPTGLHNPQAFYQRQYYNRYSVGEELVQSFTPEFLLAGGDALGLGLEYALGRSVYGEHKVQSAFGRQVEAQSGASLADRAHFVAYAEAEALAYVLGGQLINRAAGAVAGVGIPKAIPKAKTSPAAAMDEGGKTCPPKFKVQKQLEHVPGTPANLNRLRNLGGKPRPSTFFSKEQGELVTKIALEKGTRTGFNTVTYDFRFPVGVGPRGGLQTRVTVHMGKKDGRIHGHPSGQEHF